MTKKIRLYHCLFLVLTCHLAYAQKTQVFNNLVYLNGDVYKANFNYYVSKKDTLYHGPFTLTKEIEEAVGNKDYKYAAVKGNFDRNVADGEWAIRQGTFSSSGKGEVRDNAYIFKIDGNEFLAKGSLNKGRKNSPWDIYEWQITNSTVDDTLFSAHLPYRNDKINGDIRLLHGGEYLEGFIDNNQFTDKKWSFYVTGANGRRVLLKEWIFKNNQLASKVLYENGKALELTIGQPADQKTQAEEIAFDENYLEIIDLKASLNNPELYKKYSGAGKVRDLLFIIAGKLQTADSLFLPIAKTRISPEIKTRLEVFPITSAEKPLLDAALKNTYLADSLVLAVNEDPQVQLARSTTAKAAFFLSAINAVQQQVVAPNKTIIKHYEQGYLKYINRNKYINSNLSSASTIPVSYSFKDDTAHSSYQLVHARTDQNQEPLIRFKTLSENTLLELQQLKDSLDVYVHEIKREERVVESEAALVKLHEKILKLNDSLITEQHDNLAGFNVKDVLTGFSQKVLKDYSSLSIPEKNNQIEPTLNCLHKLENLIRNLENVPENTYMVRDAYTNKVFNPYTFSDMEEKVKEPIYNSFNELLLPGVFNSLKNLSCDNVTAYSKNFDNLFEGMLQVLKRNTRREERRIKRVNSAAKAAEMLHLNLTF